MKEQLEEQRLWERYCHYLEKWGDKPQNVKGEKYEECFSEAFSDIFFFKQERLRYVTKTRKAERSKATRPESSKTK